MSGLEHRGVKIQRKGSRRLWKLMYRRIRIAQRTLRAALQPTFDAIFDEPSGPYCKDGLDGLFDTTKDE